MKEQGGAAAVVYEADGKTAEAPAQAILVATGRRPNLEGLNLEAAGVELTARGEVKTDAGLRTSVPHIWAMGDVKGGLQFTYISLDDFRIVKSQILGNGERTTENRGQVAFSVFVDPPFSRVGMSEAEAVENGHKVKVGRLVVGTMPRAKLLGRTTGLMKAVVDADTGLVARRAAVLLRVPGADQYDQDRHGRGAALHGAARRNLHPPHHERGNERLIRDLRQRSTDTIKALTRADLK